MSQFKISQVCLLSCCRERFWRAVKSRLVGRCLLPAIQKKKTKITKIRKIKLLNVKTLKGKTHIRRRNDHVISWSRSRRLHWKNLPSAKSRNEFASAVGQQWTCVDGFMPGWDKRACCKCFLAARLNLRVLCVCDVLRVRVCVCARARQTAHNFHQLRCRFGYYNYFCNNENADDDNN